MQTQKTKAVDLPPELSIYVPRPVRLTAAGKTLAGLAAALAVAGMLVPALMWSDRERKAEFRARLDRHGVTAIAVVTRTGKTGGDDPRRYAKYRYGVGAGRVEFRNSDRRRLSPGDPIAVRYLPEDPGRSWVEGYEPSGPPPGAMAAVGCSFLLGGGLLWWAIRRQRRLLEEGRAAVGRVTAVKRTKNSDGGKSYRAEYEIRLLSGAVRRVWTQGDKQLSEGALVPLVYDPENPKRIARYPMALVAVDRG